MAATRLRHSVSRQTGRPELTAVDRSTVVTGSMTAIIVAITIATIGMGSRFSVASMTVDITRTIATTIATTGAAYTRDMDGDGVGFMSAIIEDLPLRF